VSNNLSLIAAGQAPTNAGGIATAIILAIAGTLLYFVPLLVGWRRHVRNLGSVAVVNVFLGWTLIGWVVALALACRSREPVTPPASG
jgi:hypothetical protein